MREESKPHTIGSGTTDIACIRAGRRFVGIEKDPDIFETAQHRLTGGRVATATISNAATKQAKLF